MLFVSLLAAIVSLFVTPPTVELLRAIDWKTLATLFMLLSVLDGFKKENMFLPLIRLASRFGSAQKLTFFFVFSSSITANSSISSFLRRIVTGNEYWTSILLSQVISNVPASIVLWPYTENLRGLLYGLDSAGLVTIIGSLASVINLRLYNREYPGRAGEFIKWFEIISLSFFAIIVIPQYLILGM